MDTALVRWLNALAVQHAQFGRLLSWSAAHLAFVLAATFAVGWLVAAGQIWHATRRLTWRLVEAGLVAVLAFALGLGLNQLIGHLWFRSRPYDAISGLPLLLPPSPDPSFPSDHATFGFVLTLVRLALLPRLGWVLLAATILLVAGRVATGLHYPTDVLGGFLTALLAVAVADMLVRLLRAPLTRLTARPLRRVIATDQSLTTSGRIRLLHAGGLAAALLALPALLEAVADPVRLAPEWREAAVLIAAGVALAGVWALLVRTVRRVRSLA